MTEQEQLQFIDMFNVLMMLIQNDNAVGQEARKVCNAHGLMLGECYKTVVKISNDAPDIPPGQEWVENI